MELDAYFELVKQFARLAMTHPYGMDVCLSELKGVSKEAECCVLFRREMATSSELRSKEHLIEMGYFRDPDPDCSKAWWLFLEDITHAATNISLEDICARYSPGQPLFQGEPSLLDHIRRKENSGSPDFELIDAQAFRREKSSQICQLENGFTHLAPQLHPSIPTWAQTSFPNAPLFLRLDPWSYAVEKPIEALAKAAIAPADPGWLETLSLFPHTRTFACYVAEDCSFQENYQQAVDYTVYGIRRLEIAAQRREPNYLSMMIEELSAEDGPNGLMVSKCIHLDTRATVGTPMKEALLQHLDLAINVYRGQDRLTRMADSLQNGMVADATFRTHLLRIEGIPFAALFGFAQMFLTSKFLLAEWILELKI